MVARKYSWAESKNRLATGIFEKVRYYNGELNTYSFSEGLFWTTFRGTSTRKEPYNPQHGFRPLS